MPKTKKEVRTNMGFCSLRKVIRKAAKEIGYIDNKGAERTGYESFQRSCYSYVKELLAKEKPNTKNTIKCGKQYRIPKNKQKQLSNYLKLRYEMGKLNEKTLRDQATRLENELSKFQELLPIKKSMQYEEKLEQLEVIINELTEMAENSLDPQNILG